MGKVVNQEWVDEQAAAALEREQAKARLKAEREQAKKLKALAQELLASPQWELVAFPELNSLLGRFSSTLADHTVVSMSENMIAKGALLALSEFQNHLVQTANMMVEEDEDG